MSLSMNAYIPYAPMPYATPPTYTVANTLPQMQGGPSMSFMAPAVSNLRQYPGVITKAPLLYSPLPVQASFHRRNIPHPFLASYYSRSNQYAPMIALPTVAPPLQDLSVPQDGVANPLMRYYLTPPRYEGLQDPVPSRLPLDQIIRPSTIPMSHTDQMNSEPRLTSFFESPMQIERPYIQLGELDLFPRRGA